MKNRGDYLRLWRAYLAEGKQAYKIYAKADGSLSDKYRVTIGNFQTDDNVFYFLAESQGGGTPEMLHGKRFYEYYYFQWLNGRAMQVWDKVGKTWRRVIGMAHPDKYVEGSHFIFKLRAARYAKATVIEVSPVDGTMVLTTETSDLKKENVMNKEFETMTGCTVKIEKSTEKMTATKQSDLEVVVKYQAIIFDSNGMSAGTASFAKKKEAVAFVKKPENIGKTVVLFRRCCSLTTDIPVVEAE